MAAANSPDAKFVEELRTATGQYLAAVDAWETAYRKYYRLADPVRKVSGDLEEPEKVYVATRKQLAALAPRARGLCFKHGLKDPWTGLLRTSLGQYAPQDRAESAISRMERQQVNECVILLAEACAGFQPEVAATTRETQPQSWVRRLLDFFY
jgi:hypothetical protein